MTDTTVMAHEADEVKAANATGKQPVPGSSARRPVGEAPLQLRGLTYPREEGLRRTADQEDR